MVFHECEKEVKFKLKTDFDFVVTNYECSREVKEASPFRIKVNDEQITDILEGYKILRGSEIYIYDVNKYIQRSEATITIYGYNPDIVYDKRKNETEVEMDSGTQPCKDITVDEEVEIKDVECEIVE